MILIWGSNADAKNVLLFEKKYHTEDKTVSEQNLSENNLMDVQPASEAALQETNTTPSNIPLGVLGAVLGTVPTVIRHFKNVQ